MSQISEIKCPVCGKWSNSTGKIDERCPACGTQFNADRYQYEEEKRINTEKIRKDSYLVIKETDDPIIQMGKQFVNWLRWATVLGISMIYIVIAIMIVFFGLVML